MLDAEPPTPPRPSRRHWYCGVCEGWVLPRRPHWGWRATEIAVWVLFPLLIGTASKGPGIVLLPIVCLVGAGLFGPLREAAAADARCPDCRRYIDPPSR